jgi:16S rRNA (adenine1518-N6/adenine1519-N6)-dimethyltransferase
MEDRHIKNILQSNSFAFKKQFGQNFITDVALLDDIVLKSGVNKDSCVIEIGCGAGTLTRQLALAANHVYGYEIDVKLKPVLAQTLKDLDNVTLTFTDFLKLRLDELEKNLPPYRVVANLPYYITTPLIMMFIEHSKKCLSLTIMVQEEVADRLCAKANTPEYGAITANIALRGECKMIKRVGREMFYPSPNVDSAVVKIDIVDSRLPVEDEELYKKVVMAAFSSRRKTLENNLVNTFKLSRSHAQALIAECGFDLKTRGEVLTPENFATLSNNIKKYL